MTLPTSIVPALYIPSPSNGVWHILGFPLRGYALCIIAGIIAAIWIGERRWVARGGRAGEVQDLAIWAVPFGLVGGRLYHVITDHDLYFGAGKHPIDALYIWRGGLGIWGAIALGALGVYIGGRRRGIRFLPMLDALAPGVLVAQAMGRWGNWFNQELYGRPTHLPWGLEINPTNWPEHCDYPSGSGTCLLGFPPDTRFQPTFLYESLWDLGAFGVVLWADRRFKLGFGRCLALYVMTYTLGRGWIETLRIDDVELEHVLGLRLNVWTSIVLFVLAAGFFVWSSRRHPGREESMYRDGFGPETDETDETDEPAKSGEGTDEADATNEADAVAVAADDGVEPIHDTEGGAVLAPERRSPGESDSS